MRARRPLVTAVIRRALLMLALAAVTTACALPASASAGVSTSDGLWTWQNPTIGNPLAAVDFVDARHGWAVGADGTVLSTDDSGLTWQGQTTPTTSDLTDVCFVDSRHGWAVGQVRFDPANALPGADLPGVILATTDGGRHWAVQDLDGAKDVEWYLDLHLRSVSFGDTQHGCAVGWVSLAGGSRPVVLTTSDGGRFWKDSSPDIPRLTLISVALADARRGWALGSAGADPPTIYATIDGGSTWIAAHTAEPGCILNDLACAGSERIWAVGMQMGAPEGADRSCMVASTDGGSQWHSVAPGLNAELRAVDFADRESGWAVGTSYGADRDFAAAALCTSDGGASWQATALPGRMIPCGVGTGAAGRSVIVGGDPVTVIAAPGEWHYLLTTTDGGRDWVTQPGATNADLHSVAFVDLLRGTAVGAAGTMLRTTDGGERWMLQPSVTTADLNAIVFVDRRHGWAVGTRGTILSSADAGASWHAQGSGTTSTLRGVTFVDRLHGWAAGDDGTIVGTADGGLSWRPQQFSFDAQACRFSAICFTDATHGWAIGEDDAVPDPWYGSGRIVRTTDGRRWRACRWWDGNPAFNGVYFVDAGHGWLIGGKWSAGGAWTADGGIHWEYSTVRRPGRVQATWIHPFRAVMFIDRRNGWAVGDHGTVAATADGGKTWHIQNSGTSRDLRGAWCVDRGHAWVVGEHGTILKGPMPIPEAPYAVRVRRGALAKIRYKISNSSVVTARVTIMIRNARGRTKKTLRCKRRPSNKWLTARFRCRLPRGTYRFSVYALDSAGNRQVAPATNRLVVR